MTKFIPVTFGVGTGPTPLSAFDNALFAAGIANYNLLPLSSVIPLGYQPHVEAIDWNGKEQGHRLYIVEAVKQSHTEGENIAAGIGWVMAQADPCWGLFVEHVGETEEDVRRQVEQSLLHMTSYRTETKWSDVQSKIVSAKCFGEPVCVLVAALYQSKGWD